MEYDLSDYGCLPLGATVREWADWTRKKGEYLDEHMADWQRNIGHGQRFFLTRQPTNQRVIALALGNEADTAGERWSSMVGENWLYCRYHTGTNLEDEGYFHRGEIEGLLTESEFDRELKQLFNTKSRCREQLMVAASS